MSEINAVIRKCRLFRGLSEELIGLLAQDGGVRNYPAGQRIFADGDECPGVFIVADGLVRISKCAPNGKVFVLHFAEPGETFAEVAAMGGFACPADAEAVHATRCALIPADRFRRRLQENHGLCLQLLSGMAMWVRHLVGQVEDIALRDATGRLARFLLSARESAEPNAIELPMAWKDVAGHLNVTSETLSRTLRRLAEAGLIELTGTRSLIVADRASLAEIAEGLPTGEFVA